MFISIEGPDGVGKSTIIKKLSDKYPDAQFIREPGTTKFGENIRSILLLSDYDLEKETELLLFVASFCETSAKVIRKANKEGRLVFADRWFYSTIAYQLFANRDSHYDRILHFLKTAIHNSKIETPNINFVLFAPWDVIQKRIEKRHGKKDNFESRELSFYKKVHEYYEKKCEGVRIDANRTPDEIFEEIVQKIDKSQSS